MPDRLGMKDGGRQLTEFGDLLKANSKGLRLQMRRELKPVKDRIVGEVKTAADSAKVARTVKGSIRGTGNQVRMVFTAGKPGEPLARLRERGNLDRPSTAATFRHPAWGRWKVKHPERLEQKKHPFFVRTIKPKTHETADAMRVTVEKTWRRSQPPHT